MSLPKITDLGNRCCGCAACASICPASAVSINFDSCGFPFSEVDETRCVQCGKCDSVCPCLVKKRGLDPLQTFGVQSADEKALASSSSGGVFNLLASRVLTAGGTVYGACFDDGFKRVLHKRVASLERLDSIMRSKYVQSVVSEDVYRKIDEDLRTGKQVMFAGTQCQAAAVKLRFQHHERFDGLLVVDVICHGVPSPELWRRYINYLETQAQSSVVDVNFRKKSPSWASFSVFVGFENGRTYEKVFYDDWFMKTFLQNASLRDACFDCPGKGLGISDITLGDFWGIGETKLDTHFDSALGVSAVLLNSQKGVAAFEEISQDTVAVSCSLKSIVAGNSPLLDSVRPHEDHEGFLKAVGEGAGIDSLRKHWGFDKTPIAKAKALLKKMSRKLHLDHLQQ